jgi:hypothetical protein
MTSPTPPHSFRFLLLAAVATISVLVAGLVQLRRAGSGPQKAGTLRIEAPGGYFERNGYLRLDTPIRLPERAGGKNKTEIFLKVPAGRSLDLARRGERWELSYPTGTHAARVESVLRDGPKGPTWTVADIRATEFVEQGQEFQVYRPESREVGAALIGVSWRRGDVRAQKHADEWIEEAAKLGVSARAKERAARKARSDNACTSCHAPFRPDARTERQFGAVHRGTDAGGLFVPRTIVENAAPLENYAPVERNWDDPFITVSCDDGDPPRLVEGKKGTRAVCASGAVPRATFGLDEAMEAGDEHGLSVCASRRALFALLPSRWQRHFFARLAECGESRQ